MMALHRSHSHSLTPCPCHPPRPVTNESHPRTITHCPPSQSHDCLPMRLTLAPAARGMMMGSDPAEQVGLSPTSHLFLTSRPPTLASDQSVKHARETQTEREGESERGRESSGDGHSEGIASRSPADRTVRTCTVHADVRPMSPLQALPVRSAP